ncbi:MAG: aldehyde dehydrogenase [Candidatus Poribacteria bacterium]|nr:aldehyde dehydrogenase [Candidatus Poribacteria bacterium]
MAEVSQEQIEAIVSEVVETLRRGGAVQTEPTTTSVVGVFNTADQAVAAAKQAQADLVALGFKKREELIAAIRQAGLEHAQPLAELAVQDTGMGVVDHKRQKNEGAANLSPGIEDLKSEVITGDDGTLLVEYAPFGVINSITPTTNPTSTVINHAIVMLSAGNAVIFSPHPNAYDSTIQSIAVVNQAIVAAGGPPNLLTAVKNATLRTVKEIMSNDDVSMVVATGGHSVVKAALASGKKAIAAGPGNPPAMIDETADLANAAESVINGTSFDNNLLCIGEKSLFVVQSVANEVLSQLTQSGGYLLANSQLKKLEDLLDGDNEKDYIGKDATEILKAIGINAPSNTLAILAEVSADHIFVINEYLMPILPVVRVQDFEEALSGAVRAEGGRGHTGMLHTRDMSRVTRFRQAMNCSVIVINQASVAAAGFGGEGFLAMTIAGPTGEGFTKPTSFTRQQRLTVANDLSRHTLA